MAGASYFMADTDTLIPYINNARTHDAAQVDQIAASIQEFGFLAPIVISADNTILAGHGRYFAAQKLGLEKVPCIREDYLTPAQKKAYIIADNKISLNAGWDNDLLSQEIRSLQEEAFDLGLTGIDTRGLEKLLNERGEIEDDNFNINAALALPDIAEKGDIWHLGRHRLLCGSMADGPEADRLLGGRKANAIITAVPTGLEYSRIYGGLQGMAERLAKDGTVYIFHKEEDGINTRRAFSAVGFHLACVCVWIKDKARRGGESEYMVQHESILYGFRSGARHAWFADHRQVTVWTYRLPASGLRPLGVLGYPMTNATRENGIVLDGFAGAGGTIMAAEKLKRIGLGAEENSRLVSAAVRRYAAGGEGPVCVERKGRLIPYGELMA